MVFIFHFVTLVDIQMLNHPLILGLNPLGYNVLFVLCVAEFDLLGFCCEILICIHEGY